jgi:riboflavin kinase/FMN adenylyltransferase
MNQVLRGRVVAGSSLGRRLGFPTANLTAWTGDLPDWGVYEVEALWDGAARPALCDVGVRPTVGPDGAVRVEVHIPGFQGDLLGKELSVRFVRKIRDERKFDSLDALAAQIRKDVASLRSRPSSRKPR